LVGNKILDLFKPKGTNEKGDAMIIVKIMLNALADKHLEVTQTLISLIKPVAKETGCRNYTVFCDIHDRNRFCMIGEWKTRKDLDQHIRSTQFAVLLGIKPLLCESLDINIYTISHLQGMEAIEAVRTKGVSDYSEISNPITIKK